MAETPTIALWTDVVGTALELTGFRERSLTTLTDSAFIRFDGDSAPRGFRSEAIYRTWNVQAHFAATENALAKQLIELLELAYLAADGRLYFDHGGRMADVVPFAFSVECHSWDLEFDPPGSGIPVVSFELREVNS